MDPQQQQPNPNPQYTAPVTPDGSQNPNLSQFPPAEPPKPKKNGLLVIGIIAAVIVVAVIAVLAMGSNKKDDTSKTNNGNSSSNASSSDETTTSGKFQKYDVSDKANNVNFSVSFYKDASTSEKNGRTFLTSGEAGSQYSVYLTPAKADKLDCGGTPSTTMKLNGESTTVCYESKNTQYAGYVTVNATTLQLNVAGQKAISMEDAKAILESVTFN